MKSGRASWQKEEETRKDFSIVLILQEKFFTSELFKVIQDTTLIDPSLQDNVLIPDDFFKYIYHAGCAINVHSIINSGLIPGGQNLSKRQTVFFLPVDPLDKNHKDPDTIDLNEPRLAQYMQTAWKKHQNTVYWVDINLALKERIEVLSNTIERYHPLRHTPSLLSSESCSDGNWRNQQRKSF